MTKLELENEATRLGLRLISKTRDGWPYSWAMPNVKDLNIWRIKSGFQTAFLLDGMYQDHKTFPTLNAVVCHFGSPFDTELLRRHGYAMLRVEAGYVYPPALAAELGFYIEKLEARLSDLGV